MIKAASQCPRDTEEEFGTRLESYAGVCSGFFNEHLLVNCFLRELLPTTAAFGAAQVH